MEWLWNSAWGFGDQSSVKRSPKPEETKREKTLNALGTGKWRVTPMLPYVLNNGVEDILMRINSRPTRLDEGQGFLRSNSEGQ